MHERHRRLMWHGALLLLLGLLTGLAGPLFANPRMGLSAHLEGVLNGLLLMAAGALWPQLRLSPGQQTATFALALYGTYANWAVTTLAAVFGTGAMTPLAAAGRSAAAWQEGVVSVGFASVAVSMIATALLLLWGLRSPARP